MNQAKDKVISTAYSDDKRQLLPNEAMHQKVL